MLSGVKGETNTISWGADLNLTFGQLLSNVLTYSLESSDVEIIVSSVNEHGLHLNKYTDALKRNFYVGSYGFCWDLENYTISELLVISARIKGILELIWPWWIVGGFLVSHCSLT